MSDLVSVLYSSDAAEPFDDERLAALLAQSRASNERRNITGMLLYRAGRFIQVIEGPARQIRELVATLAADTRHARMRVLFEEPVAERQFADWTMGYQPIAEPAGPVPAGFRDTFEDLEGRDTNAMMRAARELSLWFRVRAARPA